MFRTPAVTAASPPVVTTTSARHDTLSDVKIFLAREHPERINTIEVVCSSARRDMERHAKHVPYRLFCETLGLFPEFKTQALTGGGATHEWPRTTSIACWHDCHPFDTTPIPIPKYTRGNAPNNTFTVYGVFCSCNCAVAYILERNTYDQQHLLLRFRQMMIDVFHMTSAEVFAFEPAPPRIFLRLFGGHLDIDDFRRRSLVTRSTLLTHPFISYSMVLEENSRQVGNAAAAATTTTTTTETTASASASSSHYPALTHTVRGLRRPPPVTTAPPPPPPTTTTETTDASTSCLFSQFVTEKLAAAGSDDVVATGGGDDDASREGGSAAAAAAATVKPKYVRKKTAKAAAGKGGATETAATHAPAPPPLPKVAAAPAPPPVTVGPLAAFLQNGNAAAAAAAAAKTTMTK